MNEPRPSIESLQAELALLREAVLADEHVRAAQLLGQYQARLRLYVEQSGPARSEAGLVALLEAQRELTAQMSTIRDQALTWLLANRHSTTAVRAYARAGC